MDLPAIADGEDKSSPLKNRIRKNYRHIRKWAKRTETNCFRIYDREIPSYQLAIDYYDGRFCVHYFSKTRDNPDPAKEIVAAVNEALIAIFETDESLIFWRYRVRRLKMEQYEKSDESKEFFTVIEHGVKFKVNLQDFLDTGLFLDHRETRQIVAAASKGKRVLNLFAYTCAFSVQAAFHGASFTKSVDMSNTYTSWGWDNFTLNGLSHKNNPIIRADCMRFLEDEAYTGEKYDIIIVDPPTISRSKKMEKMFDIQEDYVQLLSKALGLLAKGGSLFFSTNSRKFQFDKSLFENYSVFDISKKTLPIDFQDPKIHHCWRIS